MAFAINPPNTRVIDSQGRITPEWYRFFASLQRMVGGDLLARLQDAPYITAGSTDILNNERILTDGDGIDLSFSGATAIISLQEIGDGGSAGSESQAVRITFDEYGRIAAAQAFELNTDNITEGGTNQFFTQARARNSLSAGDGIDYDNTTGEISAQPAGPAPLFPAYTAPTISNPPTQAEVQGIADAVEDISTALTSLITLLQANGNLT